jgi:hypothetical protein
MSEAIQSSIRLHALLNIEAGKQKHRDVQAFDAMCERRPLTPPPTKFTERKSNYAEREALALQRADERRGVWLTRLGQSEPGNPAGTGGTRGMAPSKYSMQSKHTAPRGRGKKAFPNPSDIT